VAESDKGKSERKPLSARLSLYADIVLKLTPAILTAVGAWFAANWQAQNAGTSLLNQREQAETQLRATMFANLIRPITGPDRDGPLSPDQESLLLELLTLNFHEHIEFKPLLVHADGRLEEAQHKLPKGSAQYAALDQKRRSLQSVVRRVLQRQMATLQKECGKGRLCPEASFVERSQCQPKSEAPAGNPQCLTFAPDANGYSPEQAVLAPDRAYELRLSMSGTDWDRRIFKISGLLGERAPGDTQPIAIERMTPFDFTLTPFDLPFTDNTIVDRYHRFSLVVKDIVPRLSETAPGGDEKNVEIWVLWFPEGYVLPNERPVNYQEIRKVLKLD